MAKSPFNNVDRSISQAPSMFPMDGEIHDYPDSGETVPEYSGADQVVQDEAMYPQSDDVDGEDSHNNVEMTEDGGAMVTLGPQPKGEVDSIGIGGNLAETLEERELTTIGSDLLNLIEDDDQSRDEWKSVYEKGLVLLGLTYDERTEPFQGATGVIHPILNEAVTQFAAQAYKELLPAGGPVRTRILGQETPENEAQADRVKEFMNYQITEVMEEFDPDYDQMLYYTGYGGSAFKKVYYDAGLQRGVSPFILPKDLIVPYGAKDLVTAERVTHVITISRNELRKAQINGFYVDVDLGEPADLNLDDIQQRVDKTTGIEPSATPEEYTLYECHCNLDLPGYEDKGNDGTETGLQLPYIVTMEKTTGIVLSIRRNYDERDPKRRKKQYFVHYKLLPGLGFYGFGLIHLLGNLSRASTSLLRQLIDAGTLSNLPGGFKAKGLRIQDSSEPIQPGEWRDVDAPGGSLRESLMPLPYKEPSATLFQLLGFCVGAAEKFIGTTDLGMSDGNQEVPVGTTIAVLERGARVMSAVHKRLHYAQKQELKLLARVFADYLPPEYPYDVVGGQRQIKQSDFSPSVDVIPVSDPNIFSMTQRITLAQEQMKLAQAAPDMHNMYQAYRRMYVALGVSDIDAILNPPQQPQPVGPATENGLLLNVPNGKPAPQVFPDQNHMAHIQTHMQMLSLPLVQNTPAAMAAFLSHISDHIGFAAQQQAQQQGQQPQMQQQGQQQPNPQLDAQVAQIEAQLTQQVFAQLNPPQQPDPLVALKSRELDIRQQQNDQNNQMSQQDLQLNEAKMGQKQQIDQQRIATTQGIAEMRVKAQLMKNGLV